MNSLFVPVGDSSLCQIVRRELQRDPVAGQHTNAIAAQLTGQVGQHGSILVELDAEQTARKFFYDSSGDLDAVFFTHRSARGDFYFRYISKRAVCRGAGPGGPVRARSPPHWRKCLG